MSDASVPNQVVSQEPDPTVVKVTRQPGVVTLWIQVSSEENLAALRLALKQKYRGIEIERLLCQMVHNLQTGEVTYDHLPLPTLALSIHEDSLNAFNEFLSDWSRSNELHLNFTLAPMPTIGS